MRGYIKQRAKGSWSISIYLGKDPITNKKKYKWYTVKGTKKEADRFLTEKLNEIEKGIFVDSKNMTLAEYMNYWFEQCCITKLSPTTYESYRRNIDKYIIQQLGNVKLSNLLPLQLQSFYNNLSTTLSNTSIVYIHRILHSSLNQAMKWDLVVRNVADNVEVPKKNKYNATILNSEQLAKLIEVIKDTYIYIPVMIAISTGMRRGEVLGLMWENIDLDNATLKVVDINLPSIRFHDLRHSHASLLLSQGVQAKVISARLGHSNINITMDLYSHIYEATNIEVANNFDVFLKTS